MCRQALNKGEIKMDKNTLVIKGSFKGIAGDFLKNFLLLLGSYIVYTIANHYKVKLYSEKEISSFFKFVVALEDMPTIIILFSIFLIFATLLVLAIYLVFKIINLLYETQKVVTIDYVAGKIYNVTYSFPLSKYTEEHKFTDIISVNIYQNMIHRLFGVGNLNIEYLTCSKVDSKLRNLEVTYLNAPVKVKQKLI